MSRLRHLPKTGKEFNEYLYHKVHHPNLDNAKVIRVEVKKLPYRAKYKLKWKKVKRKSFPMTFPILSK